jgi:hypothetical protein
MSSCVVPLGAGFDRKVGSNIASDPNAPLAVLPSVGAVKVSDTGASEFD